jgi:hypothetical protein
MNNQISSKLAAFALALAMNTCMIAAVAYLFDAQVQPHSTVTSLNHAIMQNVWNHIAA